MRTTLASLLVVVGWVGSAGADSEDPAQSNVPGSHWKPSYQGGMWVDVGAGVAQFDSGDPNRGPGADLFRGESLHFAPHVALMRRFYLGGDLGIGRFGTTGMIADSVNSYSDGHFYDVRVVAGVRELAGIFMGAFELAGGARVVTLRDFTSYEVSNTDLGIEARARLDVWLTPHFTASALVGTELGDFHDLEASLSVGFHFDSYDHARD